MRDFRVLSRCKWDLRFSGILHIVDRHPRCVKSEKSADQNVKLSTLAIAFLALVDLRYAKLCVVGLLVFRSVLPYYLIGLSR
jgi:hypothetical protein